MFCDQYPKQGARILAPAIRSVDLQAKWCRKLWPALPRFLSILRELLDFFRPITASTAHETLIQA
jgi:hypothetical protein